MIETSPLVLSYARAESVTAEWARSFHFASRFLPIDKRRAIFALYDYCRYADNLVDQRGDRSALLVREDLARLGSCVRRLHTGHAPADSRWLALFDTLQRYPVPLEPMLELLDGLATDLGPVEMPDFPALRRYCRQVAGVVSLMIGPVLGARSRDYDGLGVHLGIGMQLTNVLRDVREDLDQDRVYFPADELAEWGLSRGDLERRELTDQIRRFLAFQVRRARRYFEPADAVAAAFPGDGSRLTVRLLARTYAGILDEIERADYDVFRARAYVSSARKMLILGQALLDGRGGRRWPRRASTA
jgi:phytoene synthase